jgi:hypothetical protein
MSQSAERITRVHNKGFFRVAVLYGVVGFGGIGSLLFTALTYITSGTNPISAYGISPIRSILVVATSGFVFGAAVWLLNEIAYRRIAKG